MKKTIIILSLLACIAIQAKAYHFELNGIYYNFIEGTIDEVEVTYFIDYRHDDFDGKGDYYGDIVIPETIVYENKTYRVTRIGEQAFRESSVETITIPKSIRFIGMGALACSPKKIEFQWEMPLDLREVEKKYPDVYDYTGTYVAEDIFGFDEHGFERVTLVVPKNTKALYQKQEVWRNFVHIEEIQNSTIDAIIAITRFLPRNCRYRDGNPTHQEEADELNYFVERVFLHNWEYNNPVAVRPQLITRALELWYKNSTGTFEDATDVYRMIIRRSMCYMALAFLSDEYSYGAFLADAHEHLSQLDDDELQNKMLLMLHLIELYKELGSEYFNKEGVEYKIAQYQDDLKNREKNMCDTNFIAEYNKVLLITVNGGTIR